VRFSSSSFLSISCLYFVVDDLVKNYRLGILKAMKRARANPRSHQRRLQQPIDIRSIDARTVAEQLTYIDAVSTATGSQLHTKFVIVKRLYN